MICPPCRNAADAGRPHTKDECEDRPHHWYRGCACQHGTPTPPPADETEETDRG